MGEVNKEHPVWSILDKGRYIEEFYPEAEEMYDFIKSISNVAGNVTKDGNTVPAIEVFFNMLNEHFKETFAILISIVYDKDVTNENKGC